MNLCASDYSYVLVIRFVLRKGEGNWPQLSQLSSGERADLRRLATFFLEWDDELEDPQESGLKDVSILYDGVTPLFLPSDRFGLHIVDDAITGFPSPIIRFNFAKVIDPDSFIKTVWMSQMRLQSEEEANAGGSSFYCEDHQGYTGIADPELVDEITRALSKTGVPFDYRTDLPALLAGLDLAVV